LDIIGLNLCYQNIQVMSNEIHCPKCGSTQITATKKGFSGKKAVVGGLLTGGIGLLAGTIGSNKIMITCLACGHEFRPGQTNTANTAIKKETPVKVISISDYRRTRVFIIVFVIIFLIFSIIAISSESWGFLAFCLLACLGGLAGITGTTRKIKELTK